MRVARSSKIASNPRCPPKTISFGNEAAVIPHAAILIPRSGPVVQQGEEPHRNGEQFGRERIASDGLAHVNVCHHSVALAYAATS
jgi:hypothetical protein